MLPVKYEVCHLFGCMICVTPTPQQPKAGVATKVVSERLGHASTAITEDTYQHVLPGMDAHAADDVAALIGATP